MSLPAKKHEYGQLKFREPPTQLVYGPIESLRFGKTLGINPLGQEGKACSFNCPYCDLGETTLRMNHVRNRFNFPKTEEITTALRSALGTYDEGGSDLKMLMISGMGEPCLYPHLRELVAELVTTRDELAPGLPIGILTNATHFDQKKIVTAVNELDERFVKMDAGNNQSLKTINSPLVRTSVSKIISGCRRLKDCVVQSLFVEGKVSNTANHEIDDWIEAVALVKPKEVQISTISRVPWSEGLIPLDEDSLYTIAAKLQRRTDCKISVFSL